MSALLAPEQVCYVHCNFCNTILVVSVPGSNSLDIVTVRCGHCANLLAVNLGALLQILPQDVQVQTSNHNLGAQDLNMDCGSSSQCHRISMRNSMENVQQQTLCIRRRRYEDSRLRILTLATGKLSALQQRIGHTFLISNSGSLSMGINNNNSTRALQPTGPNISLIVSIHQGGVHAY